MQNLEYYRDNIVELTGHDTRNVPIVIEDIGSISNGFTDPLLYNAHIYTYPPGHGYYLEGNEDWFRTVSIHEYTHIAHMTKTGSSARFLTSIFGSLFQPNMYSPGWLIEGISVYAESDLSPYEGRLNDGFFDNYIGACVTADDLPSIIEATNTPLGYPRSALYLYGGEFTHYLSERYGRECLSTFFQTYGSYFWAPLAPLLPCTGIDLAAHRTFGKTLPALFHEWHRYEKKRFQDWRMEGTQITRSGWYKHSLTCDTMHLYYVESFSVKIDAFRYRTFNRIIEHDLISHNESALVSWTSSIINPLRIHERSLYYTTLDLAPGYDNVIYSGFGGTMQLHKHDLDGGNNTALFSDNIRAFCILPDSSILYARDRAHAFGSEVWFYEKGNREHVGNTELLIQELIANERYVIAVAGHDHENPDLYVMDPITLSLALLYSTPWREGNLGFAEEDRLLFTVAIAGKHAIHELDLQRDSLSCLKENGFANCGVRVHNSDFYYIGLNRNGLDLYHMPYQPVPCTLRSWPRTIKPFIARDSSHYNHGSYLDVVKTLSPAVRLPYLVPVNEEWTEWQIGCLLLGGDATNENFYSAIIAYDHMDDEPYGHLVWHSQFFTPLGLSFIYRYHDRVAANIVYPLYSRLSSGLTSVLMSMNIDSDEYFTRKTLTPGISFRFTYPQTSVTASCGFPLERHSWHSSVTRNAQICNLGISHYLAGGELTLRSAGYLDLHNPDTLTMKIRGYKTITSPKGIIVKNEYSHVLGRVRQGTWNPNIYIEDIVGALFFEYALDHLGDSFFSFGGLLKVETKFAFGFLQIIPQAGIAVTKAGAVKVFFEIVPATGNPYF